MPATCSLSRSATAASGRPAPLIARDGCCTSGRTSGCKLPSRTVRFWRLVALHRIEIKRRRRIEARSSWRSSFDAAASRRVGGPPRAARSAMPTHSRADGFLASARDILPLALGVAVHGAAQGRLAPQAGFSALQIGVMGVVVYAGSSQIIATQQWMAGAGIAPYRPNPSKPNRRPDQAKPKKSSLDCLRFLRCTPFLLRKDCPLQVAIRSRLRFGRVCSADCKASSSEP